MSTLAQALEQLATRTATGKYHSVARSALLDDIETQTERTLSMAFVNEYVPALEQETSEFFRKARAELKTGYTQWDLWTVDRANDMALCSDGVGGSLGAQNHEYWSFVDRKGYYSFITERLSKTEISADEIAITRSIGFQTGTKSIQPDSQTVACIKMALQEYKDLGAASRYKQGRLTLLDAITGKEI